MILERLTVYGLGYPLIYLVTTSLVTSCSWCSVWREIYITRFFILVFEFESYTFFKRCHLECMYYMLPTDEAPWVSGRVLAYDVEGPRCTVIYPGYIIPGYFSELLSMKYTAQFKNFTTARMHRHMYGLQWHFGVIFVFPSQDTIRCIILFTMYYFTSFYCNKYLFIPTLHGNLKFHNYSIHTIPNTAGSESSRRELPGATQFWEKTNSQQTLAYDNFLFFIDLLIQHSPD